MLEGMFTKLLICSNTMFTDKIEMASMRREGELTGGLRLVFGLLTMPEYVGNLDLGKRERARLLAGLHSYEAAYLLGIKTRKSVTSLSWLDPIRKHLMRHPKYPSSLECKYKNKTRAQVARIVNQACTDLAKTGVIDVVEDHGPHHKTYRANEGIWHRESLEKMKEMVSDIHVGDCLSIGYITLLNHNLLTESGFTPESGFKRFTLKMCSQLKEMTEELLKGWVVDWEKRNKASLVSLSDCYNQQLDFLYEERNQKIITEEQFRRRRKDLGAEYYGRVPRFPLVVINLEFEGWPLELF